MRVLLVLCLVAVAHGRTSWNPMAPTPEVVAPLAPAPEVAVPLAPELPGANIDDITRPSVVPPPPHVIELPAEIAPLVQIIINVPKKVESPVAETFPIYPVQPEVLPMPMPLPEPIPETFPSLVPETFPSLVPETYPSPQEHDIELIQPGTIF